MDKVILVINSGSSSIKFSIYEYKKKLNLLHHEVKNISLDSHREGIQSILNSFDNLFTFKTLKAIGHRIVHGGKYFLEPTLVNDNVLSKIASLNPLAPLHQPYNLEAIKIIKDIYPKLPQVACFDTSFHHTQNKLARLFAIPNFLTEEGVIRYGFHGISYEYISSVITQHIGEIGNHRVIVAHLGNGASMCGMYQCKSVVTSMTFSTLDGLMMGTRCGSIDPGVLLYLLQEKNYSIKQLEHMLYKESGLLGVSGITYDVQKLLMYSDVKAREAIDLFCYRAALEIGSLTVALKGLDALVFTAGIGENSAIIRKKICEQLISFGIMINEEANEINSTVISEKNSSVLVSVIPTNEEYKIAQHTFDIIKRSIG